MFKFTSYVSALMGILFIFVLAGCGGSSGSSEQRLATPWDAPYPLNYEGLIKLHAEGPKAVIPGKTTVIVMKVTNTSSEDILSNDVTLVLDNTADGVVPWSSANITKWSPAVDFFKIDGQVDRYEWVTGALLKGESKTWRVSVKIPKDVPNSATRWCFEGSVSMFDYGPGGISGWSDKTDSGDVCPRIWRK